MNVRVQIASFVTLAAIAANLDTAQAATLTVNDVCGGTLAGTPSSGTGDPVTVDSSGNITAQGFAGSGSYTAGFGQCDPLPADGKPICTLSASNTKVIRNTAVTLYARCTQDPGNPLTYTFFGPQQGPDLPAPDGSANAISLTFDTPGAYSYTVTAKRLGNSGKQSTPVTILVGDTTDKPSCALTMSPSSINVHETGTVQVSCQPEATSFTWDPPAATAPTPPVSPADVADLTFDSVGTFGYAVAGANAAGIGAKSFASINVAGNLQWKASATKTSGGTFNYPSGTAAGDFLLMYTISPTSLGFTAPTGWTEKQTFAWSTYAYTVKILTKFVTTDTFVVLPTNSGMSAWMVTYTGVNPTTQVGQLAAILETAVNATSCARSFSGLTNGSVVISLATERDSAFPGVPTNFNARLTTLGGIFRTTVSDRFYPLGTTATGAVTSSMISGSSGICGLIEIKP